MKQNKRKEMFRGYLRRSVSRMAEVILAKMAQVVRFVFCGIFTHFSFRIFSGQG